VAREGAVGSGESAARLLVEAKVRAELSAADELYSDAGAVVGVGSLMPAAVVVKGTPRDADRSSGTALAGADGEAARKALDALGVDGPIFATCSRPSPRGTPEMASGRLRLVIEALDPSLVIALDRIAADDVSAAFGVPDLVFGQPVDAFGRTILAVDDLEGSLTDGRKADVWQQFRGLHPAGSRG